MTKLHITDSIKEIKNLLAPHNLKLTRKEIKQLRKVIAGYALDALHDSRVEKEVWELGIEKNKESKKTEGFLIGTETHEPEQVIELISKSDSTETKAALVKVFRWQPEDGYLMDIQLPTSIPDIIEDTGLKYGGGRYQIRVYDKSGKELQASLFEIAGESLPNMKRHIYDSNPDSLPPYPPCSICKEPMEHRNHLSNGGVICDVENGPCRCHAFHSSEERTMREAHY